MKFEDDDPYALRAAVALGMFLLMLPLICVFEVTRFIFTIIKNEIRNSRKGK